MRRLDLDGVYVTGHFRAKREARDVPWRAVQAALSDPHIVEPHHGQHRFVRGRLVLVVADLYAPTPTLVTLLLRSGQQWTDDDLRAALKGLR